MNLKTYHAYSMAEALTAVKHDLGPDAVILNTRSFKRGGFLGLARRTVIEVTATAAAQVTPTARTPEALQAATSKPASRAAMRAYRGSGNPPAGASEASAVVEDGPSKLDLLKTRRLAQAMLAQHERKEQAAAAPAEPERSPSFAIDVPVAAEQARPAATLKTSPRRRRHVPAPPAPPAPPAQPDLGEIEPAQVAVAKRFILTPARATPATAMAEAGGSPAGHSAVVEPAALDAGSVALLEEPPPKASPGAGEEWADRDAQEMRDELLAIRSMVGEVLQRQVTSSRSGPIPTMPQALFDMYLKLIGQDLSEELADHIVDDVREELALPELEDEAIVREAVRRRLADYIPAADESVPLRTADGRPLTIALIGPTGVGKTTTLAKLAATFKLRHRRKVGLITADTYRIAAVDQLRTYANIIGLPLQVVLTPGEMRQAVHALSDCDVILIDTAGRSQNDAGRLEELEQFLTAANPHETHLVLSSTAGEKVLLREAEAFSALGVEKVVLTKLDEAVSFGVLVGVIRQIGKKLSFLTTGQEVPDHIEAGRPERLAGLVLGEKVHQ